MNDDLEKMKYYLSILDKKVSKHLEIVPSNNIPALHISPDHDLKDLIPRIGKRQGDKEDRTVPRICVSSTLIGCLVGYAAAEYEFMNKLPKDKLPRGIKETWRGGWYIYQIPFEYGLRPDTKLVYDAPLSKEFWLVNYKANVKYIPNKVGKIFINKAERVYTGQGFNERYMYYIKVDDTIILEYNEKEDTSVTLKKGCYRLSLESDGGYDYKKDFTLEAITESEFENIRKETVSLLSFSDNPSIHW